ncbi:microtubule-associated protein, MAP65/Ase1/PRC1, partial [Kipferlia bialata]
AEREAMRVADAERVRTLEEERDAAIQQCQREADELVKHHQAQVSAENSAKLQAERDRHATAMQLSKLRHSSMLWRNDYTKHVQQHYASLIVKMQEKASERERESAEQVMKEREREVVEAVKLKEQEERHKEEMAALTLAQQKQEEERQDRLNKANQAKLAELSELSSVKTHLSELWEVLEITPEDRHAFTSRILMAPEQLSAGEMLEECKKESKRLTDMVPIVELIVKREFVLSRYRELQKMTTSKERLFSPSQRLLAEDRHRAEISQNMASINRLLIPQIRRYEAEHRQPFVYRGVGYLEQMQGEKIDKR